MKLRKLLISLLAVMMVFSAMNITAFAEADEFEEEVSFDFMADFYLDNEFCVEQEKLQNFDSMTITKDADPSVSITVPVVYYEEWDCYEAYKDFGDNDPEKAAYDTLVADAAAVQKEELEKAITELEDLLSPKALKTKMDAASDVEEYEGSDVMKGYTLTLGGLETDHYKYGIMSQVFNRDMTIFGFDMAVKLYFTMLEITLDEGEAQPETYAEFFDILAQHSEPAFENYEAMLVAAGYPEEAIAEELEAMKLMDEDLANARDESYDYPTELWIDVDLLCDCPVMMEYEIQHHYYKIVDGKLQPVPVIVEDGDQYDEWYEYRYFLGEEGTEISAKDYQKPEYDGVEYEYVGSYDIDAMWIYENEPYTAYDEEFKLDSYELGDYCDGLILVYVAEETSDNTVSEEVPEEDVVADDNDEAAPPTGDEQPVGLYIGLFVIAVAAAGGLVVYKRKRR